MIEVRYKAMAMTNHYDSLMYKLRINTACSTRRDEWTAVFNDGHMISTSSFATCEQLVVSARLAELGGQVSYVFASLITARSYYASLTKT